MNQTYAPRKRFETSKNSQSRLETYQRIQGEAFAIRVTREHASISRMFVRVRRLYALTSIYSALGTFITRIHNPLAPSSSYPLLCVSLRILAADSIQKLT